MCGSPHTAAKQPMQSLVEHNCACKSWQPGAYSLLRACSHSGVLLMIQIHG